MASSEGDDQEMACDDGVPEAAFGEADTNMPAAADPDLAFLLKLLVEGDFIEAPELGLIGSTCRVMRVQALQDGHWSYLCKKNFREITRLMSQRLIEAKGHRWLYRKLTKSRRRPVERTAVQMVPLPPPTLTSSEIAIAIKVQFKGKSILSKNLTGDELVPLLQNGTLTLDLDNQVDMGCFVPLEKEDGEDPMDDVYECDDDASESFSASMFLSNLSSNDMLCIFSSCASGDAVVVDAEFSFHPEISTEVWGIGIENAYDEMPLRASAKSLIDSIRGSPGHAKAIPYVYFDLALMPGQCSPAEKMADGSVRHCKKLDPETRLLSISFDKIKVSITLRMNCETQSEEQSGVSMLHLLEHVDWDAGTS